MTRAHGRKGTGRPVTVAPDEAREIGLSGLQNPEGSPIPGLTGNITNYDTVRQQPAVPDDDLPEFRGMMAHGVKHNDERAHERADRERGGSVREPVLKYKAPQRAIIPVPVTIVEGASENVFISAAPRHITVPPNAGADPVRVCGRSHRNRIGLLNEDTATNIRIATRPSDLVNGGGALIPWPANAYFWFETQDELYACTVSATLSVVMSIVEEYDQAF